VGVDRLGRSCAAGLDLGYRAYFDHLLYSCELGFTKPSAEYFSSALAKIAIEPSEVLFIDDHEANVSAAGSCRLHADRFHLSEGVGRINEILKGYGLDVPDQSARADRRRVDA
jgi:FMN phosphatase YigB (HAD superfamily)